MTGGTDKDRREGRGRLSSIDLLPEEAEEHIVWANAQLRDRAMPQNQILAEFNSRLADLGIGSISKGAFSRYSVRLAIETRKLEASRQITDAVLARMDPADRQDSTLAAIELLKFRILSMVMDEDEPDVKLLGQAALAVSRLSSTALREAEGQRKDKAEQREEDARARAAEAERAAAERAETAATVETIAREAGLSAEKVAAIRKGVLGLSG